MAVYKTPGVYVEEKSIFPPSVAQVATAIPAFIGYTEKADDRAKNDLHLKPKKISSLLEYRQYFGGPPSLKISTVKLDSNNSLVEANVQPKYLLYDSLQLFFLNGGGECYIVSVGKYGDSIQLGDRSNQMPPGLDVGLAVLEKEDEPTILLFPDAVLLSNADHLYTLQVNALNQSNALKDRVVIFDLREQDIGGSWEEKLGVKAFRDKIGTINLKYGTAYTPYLKTNLPKDIRYKDIRNNTANPNRFTRSGAAITLMSLTTDIKEKSQRDQIQSLINQLDTAVNDVELIASELEALATTFQGAPFNIPETQSKTLRTAFEYLHNTAAANNTAQNYYNLLDFLYRIIAMVDGWIFDTASPSHTSTGAGSYQEQALSQIFPSFDTAVTNLIAFDKGAEASIAGDTFNRFLNFVATLVNVTPYTAEWTAAGAPTANDTPFAGAPDDAGRRNQSLPFIKDLFEQLVTSVDALVELGNSRMKALEDSLLNQFSIYKNLVEQLNQALSTIPASGAIAGVYAQVDANRGVWKAPANVSLNGVTGLTYNFSQFETDNLNVDTNFGKSINAIKFMTGMGFMVWGARTLAGNDNEWRYISVRRFFNMVEESIKKSTMWAVFEPNDATTWVKVKGMIENFLTLQWRNGALQGAKPDEAFFVKIGLGETMISLDILEGRMNVEIGMAVVRPAEFIILTFSHKLVQF